MRRRGGGAVEMGSEGRGSVDRRGWGEFEFLILWQLNSRGGGGSVLKEMKRVYTTDLQRKADFFIHICFPSHFRRIY